MSVALMMGSGVYGADEVSSSDLIHKILFSNYEESEAPDVFDFLCTVAAKEVVNPLSKGLPGCFAMLGSKDPKYADRCVSEYYKLEDEWFFGREHRISDLSVLLEKQTILTQNVDSNFIPTGEPFYDETDSDETKTSGFIFLSNESIELIQRILDDGEAELEGYDPRLMEGNSKYRNMTNACMGLRNALNARKEQIRK
jgi:hypothetical protein